METLEGGVKSLSPWRGASRDNGSKRDFRTTFPQRHSCTRKVTEKNWVKNEKAVQIRQLFSPPHTRESGHGF